jgi:hypothetical protein
MHFFLELFGYVRYSADALIERCKLPAAGSLHPACPSHLLQHLCEQEGTGFASSFSHEVFVSQHWCFCETVIRQTGVLRYWLHQFRKDARLEIEMRGRLGNAELIADFDRVDRDEHVFWMFILFLLGECAWVL